MSHAEASTDGGALAAAAAPPRQTLVNTAAFAAMEAQLMQLECGFTRGFAGLQLLGAVSEVCRDGKERARVALEGLGIRIPPRRLVMSLTPADVKMDGSQLDLAVAVTLALLLGDGPVGVDPSRWMFVAELGLGGELRPVRGMVSFALAALAAGLEGLVVAPENLHEVSVLVATVSGDGTPLKVRSCRSLSEVLTWLFAVGATSEVPRLALPPSAAPPTRGVNFDDMILSPTLELAVLTAATGMHSMLMRGAPGTGKSMLAARLPSVLPDLARQPHIDAMRIYSGCMERLPPALLAGRPPYRAPHHQASAAAVIGSADAPGELALAHGGVLFLDELPEFRRDLLEALREPLETGEVRIARSQRKTVWKAGILLVAACNHCPCGWAGSARRLCICGNGRLLQYRQRLSGPILDRIDLHLNMPEPEGASAELFLHLAASAAAQQTERMLARVIAARAFAAARSESQSLGVVFNRDLGLHQLIQASGLPAADFGALVQQIIPDHTGTRSLLRCMKVARTLGDLRQAEAINADDVRQAWRWQSEPAARERGDDLRALGSISGTSSHGAIHS